MRRVLIAGLVTASLAGCGEARRAEAPPKVTPPMAAKQMPTQAELERARAEVEETAAEAAEAVKTASAEKR